MGLVTPGAFSRYDPSKVPQSKYFQEVMENSLTVNQIGLFCEDFFRLLNFNQKKHKESACLFGEPDNGKTSLFYPILGLIHHSNVAAITKQKVFNKAIIGKTTESIFIDEATPSSLDVDDWKILTQGGSQPAMSSAKQPSHFSIDVPCSWLHSKNFNSRMKIKRLWTEGWGITAAHAPYGMYSVGCIEHEGRYSWRRKFWWWRWGRGEKHTKLRRRTAGGWERGFKKCAFDRPIS